jgi:hypothetical protein
VRENHALFEKGRRGNIFQWVNDALEQFVAFTPIDNRSLSGLAGG